MQVPRRHIRRAFAAAVAAGTFLAGTQAAWADHNPGHASGCSAAVCQYVEQVPTSSGSQVAGVGSGKKAKKLPKAVESELQREAGEDAAVLQEVATASEYGAPQEELQLGPAEKRRLKEAEETIKSEDVVDLGGAVSAPVSVLTDGSDARLVGLVIVMALIALATLAAAAYRQRTFRRPVRR